MNVHVNRAIEPDTGSRRDLVLAALRCTSLRVKLIDNELTAIGTALKGGWITPETAVEWSEEVAPGCVDVLALSILEPR